MIQDDVRAVQFAFPDANCAIDGNGCYILIQYTKDSPSLSRAGKPAKAWRNAAKLVSDKKSLQKFKRGLALPRPETPLT